MKRLNFMDFSIELTAIGNCAGIAESEIKWSIHYRRWVFMDRNADYVFSNFNNKTDCTTTRAMLRQSVRVA